MCNLFSRSLLFVVLASNGLSLAQQEKEPASQSSEQADRDKKNTPASGTSYEVTVTATRTPTEIRQLGQSVTVITADQIEAQGARSIVEVLETMPGFSVAAAGSFGAATSVFVRGGENNFNLVLIDGIQVNQAGGDFDFGDLGTANVERIEIVRGPASVLYGADAVSSTINIITREGSGQPTGSLGFEGGTFDSYLIRGQVAGGAERIHYSLAGRYSETDGIHPFNNQYNRSELSARTDFSLNQSSSVTALARATDSEYHFPTDFAGAVLDPNNFRKTDEQTYSVSYQNQLNSRVGTQVQYGFHRRNFRDFTLQDNIVDFFDSTFENSESRNALEWLSHARLNKNHLLSGGVAYEREETISGALSRRSVGGFVQDQFSWADRFFVTAGIRFDDNNRFQNFTSGNLAAAYLVSDRVKLRASLGNGFRAPSFVEIIGFPSFGIVGNDNLVPEKSVATDFGIDYLAANGKAGVSGSVFFNRFSNLIEFSFLVPVGSPNYLNIEAAESQGLELEAFVMGTDHFRLGGHYTFTHTEVTNPGTVPGGQFERGMPLLRRPRHLSDVYAEFLRKRYKLRVDLKYKGRRDDIRFFPDFSSARVSLPSYWKVDFGATIPVLALSDSRGDLALVFRGENIFNRRYTEIAGFDSPGRRLVGGLEIGF